MSAVARKPELRAAEVTLHPMRRRHLRSVMRIEAAVYPRPWSLGLFLQEIARRGDRAYLVARWNGGVIGYGGLLMAASEAHITTIAVDPAYQRRRVGLKLMLALMDVAIERGARSVSLEVRKTNFAAQTMYEKFGFRPVGIRKSYYVETGEDAVVMWVDSVGTPVYARRLDRLRAALEKSRG